MREPRVRISILSNIHPETVKKYVRNAPLPIIFNLDVQRLSVRSSGRNNVEKSEEVSRENVSGSLRKDLARTNASTKPEHKVWIGFRAGTKESFRVVHHRVGVHRRIMCHTPVGKSASSLDE
jgi:hypothetical protein